ncbi:MAG: hypothetical protein A2X36_11340 [Elusimicrobia bacterium GWA2_69_24]|nr:MAG: hypothetical protein A2X36_11340 [Elusimicrobia bacterium GWA2_69_24]
MFASSPLTFCGLLFFLRRFCIVFRQWFLREIQAQQDRFPIIGQMNIKGCRAGPLRILKHT